MTLQYVCLSLVAIDYLKSKVPAWNSIDRLRLSALLCIPRSEFRFTPYSGFVFVFCSLKLGCINSFSHEPLHICYKNIISIRIRITQQLCINLFLKSLTTITTFFEFDFYLSGGSLYIMYVLILPRDLRQIGGFLP